MDDGGAGGGGGVAGGVGGDVADGGGGLPALGIALTLIFLRKRRSLAGACVDGKRCKLAISSNAAAHAKKVALEKFRKSAADPARGTADGGAKTRRTVKNIRELEKADMKST